MPHIIIEHSSNIDNKNDIIKLLPIIHDLLVSEISANINACKSRVYELDNYLVADNIKKSFIHITIKIMSGRSEEQKNNFGNILLKKLNDFFKDLPNLSNLSISLEIAELQNYFK